MDSPPQPHGYASGKEFRREIRRVAAWYQRPHLGGASLWNHKLALHYQRLQGKRRQEGLLQWHLCGQVLRRANLKIHSGTVAVERQWSYLTSVLPMQNRGMREDTWRLLSGMTFLRSTWLHFNNTHPWTRRDSALQQKYNEVHQFLQELRGDRDAAIQQELRQMLEVA